MKKLTMKSKIAVFAAAAVMVAVLAGCANAGGAASGQTAAESTVSESAAPESTADAGQTADDSWYELEDGILTVRIPDPGMEGYTWNASVADDSKAELITTETEEDGTFVASFRSIGQGTGNISFSYAKGEDLAQARNIQTKCSDDAITEVTVALADALGEADAE